MEINKTYEFTFIENKSKFISLLIPLNSKEEYKDKLLEVKKIYPNATHYCYAFNFKGYAKAATHYCYAFNFKGYAKASDDNEPKGTAGKPILRVLQLKNIDNGLLVVIRYFGGIKLGASKLLRTYVKASSEVINLISKERGE